ncbi:MAG TPA: GntR family transcriptional regulator [Dehalococcoidia bacterium]|nr:GntR family transcriptional regulator [Dehalococcoidia bacterium]
MEFKPWDNLDEQIAEHISSLIIKGELTPGERIREAKLAEDLGVSRGPIREALRILEGRRLVKLIPRRGARVTELSTSSIERLYDVLVELLTLTARKAAENRTKEDLARIRRALRKIETCAGKGDTSGYYDAIFEFFVASLIAAKNPLLSRLLRDLEPSTRRIQYASLARRKEDLKSNVLYFEQATKYIEDRNSETASQSIRKYAQNEKVSAVNNTKPLCKKEKE